LAATLVAAPVAVPAGLAAMTAEERAAILAPTTDFTAPERWEDLSGGSATNRTRLDRDAFSQPSASLSFVERADFFVGNGVFKRLWVTAPASTEAADGLGPLYNARACQRCHLKDGRGHPPAPGAAAVSMFLRLSIPPEGEVDRAELAAHRRSVIPEPTYGTQLQNFAIQGLAPEGRMAIGYEEVPVELAGGEVVQLRKPTYTIEDLAYGPLHPEAMTSPRVAQPMIGLGLLEAIAEDELLARADPDDEDGDGISGRANRVWSDVHGAVAMGRFGWKAGKATIAEQGAAAMAGDIGVSNPLEPRHWGDCTEAQAACLQAPTGASPQYADLEAPAEVMELVTFYSRHLAVPARRDAGDPQVLRGKALFYEAGCISCHVPKHATRSDHEDEALAGQLIWPYTDLLLHDMGEGLADHRPEGEASGREWRTAPLWGIGLTETVGGHTFFLHDGRARNLTEAILWHGGEAEAARERFRLMDPENRAAVLAFLNSL
jgi:CxxC motif-containing protein (DUF1111 family)